MHLNLLGASWLFSTPPISMLFIPSLFLNQQPIKFFCSNQYIHSNTLVTTMKKDSIPQSPESAVLPSFTFSMDVATTFAERCCHPSIPDLRNEGTAQNNRKPVSP
mmetsp:Transcript_62005/g.151446  ORF Transcript_62005/g.151446 Transcript_62005/m.151446 type:complete len:105 (-) Transcript_62005:1749-2063(-)